jgi:hypothetical protein
VKFFGETFSVDGFSLRKILSVDAIMHTKAELKSLSSSQLVFENVLGTR